MPQLTRGAAGANTGGSDIFLKIKAKKAGEIKGEVTDKDHAGEIQINTMTWSVKAASAIGSTQATGRRSYTGLTVTKAIDAASTRLMNMLINNDEIKEAVLSVRKAGGTQGDYFVITLNAARVVNVTQDVDSNGLPFETVVINFTKVKAEYRDQSGAGSLAATSTFEDEILAES